MNPLSRRKALGTVAAAAAALPALGLPIRAEAGGELAKLVKRYFAEVEAYNALPDMDDGTMNGLGDRTWGKTTSELIGVPVRCREDALAAMDWLIYEARGNDLCLCDTTDWTSACKSLVLAVRDYLRGATA